MNGTKLSESSLRMDDKSTSSTKSNIVDLEREDIDPRRFYWDHVSESYLYTRAMKPAKYSSSNEARQLVTAEEFYSLENVRNSAKLLDVEKTKFTPKLAKDIIQILERYGVNHRLELNMSDANQARLLDAQYLAICQIRMDPHRKDWYDEVYREMMIMAHEENSKLLLDTAVENENQISEKVEFRRKVLLLLEDTAVYDRTDPSRVQRFKALINKSETPERMLGIVIEQIRSVHIYTTIRDIVVSKLTSDEQAIFGSNLSYKSFMKNLKELHDLNGAIDFCEKMIPLINPDNVWNLTLRHQDDPEELGKAIFKYAREFRDTVRFYDSVYTKEEQLTLYRYESVKTLERALTALFDGLTGVPREKPQVLEEVMTLPDMLAKNDGCLKKLEDIVDAKSQIMSLCQQKKQRMEVINNRNRSSQDSSTNTRGIDYGDASQVVDHFLQKLSNLDQRDPKPIIPWHITKKEKAVMAKYPNESFTLQANQFIEKGWLVHTGVSIRRKKRTSPAKVKVTR